MTHIVTTTLKYIVYTELYTHSIVDVTVHKQSQRRLTIVSFVHLVVITMVLY